MKIIDLLAKKAVLVLHVLAHIAVEFDFDSIGYLPLLSFFCYGTGMNIDAVSIRVQLQQLE